MKLACYIFLAFMITSCNTKKSNEIPLDLNTYKAEVEQWHHERIESLKGSNGWLNLAGLFWLKEGVSKFGSDESNDIVFPKEKIPAKAGVFLLQNGVVTMTTLPAVEILINEQPIKSGVVFFTDYNRQPKN